MNDTLLNMVSLATFYFIYNLIQLTLIFSLVVSFASHEMSNSKLKFAVSLVGLVLFNLTVLYLLGENYSL